MKTVTFGELMLRLAPCGKLRFLQEPYFCATFGGGEANVAVCLSELGGEAAFVTKLPDNDIAAAAVKELKGLGVDVSKIRYGNGRLGLYYLEKGASQRPSKVIYDREYSAFALSKKDDFDFDAIFRDADWFHFTGITPALSDNAAALCLAAVKTAKRKGLTVSCDINYRKNLWSKEKACEVLDEILQYADVIIGNEQDASDVFGIASDGSDAEKGVLNKDGYVSAAARLKERFQAKAVAFTLRKSVSADKNTWSAMMYDGEAHFSREYDLNVVDRVGGGDSFAGGLIYAMTNGFSANNAVEFAAAVSCLKQTSEGDYSRVTYKEVATLLENGGSGRVQR